VPISYHGRTYKEGKKISWKDGFSAVWVIARERLMGGRDLSHVHRTLDTIAPLHRYHRFLWNAVSDHAGDRILEAGSGIGNISQFFLQRPHVWLTDVDETFLRNLRSRFESRPNVEVRRLDLTRPLGPDNCEDLRDRADTAVAFNVVEHLEDDLQAFRTLGEALEPGGHLLVVIPAGPALYGALDEELEHIRRYRRADLEAVIAEAGFDIVSTTRANAIGALGWWLNGRILRRRHIPRFQARLNNLLVPLLRLERALRIPFGLSLVVVARRREAGAGPA
jgi:SAM-dependent methyltransferase